MALNQRWAILPDIAKDHPGADLCLGCQGGPRGEEKPLKLHDHGPDAFCYFAKSEIENWRLEG